MKTARGLKIRDEQDRQVIKSLHEYPHFLPPTRISPPPRVVLDLGCWIGYTSIAFARMWPRARIIAVDADESNATLAERNCRNFMNITVIHAAIGDDSEQRFLRSQNKNQRSLFGEGFDTAMDVISVDDILSDLIDGNLHRRVIGFCKMDIEGAELEALKGEWLWRTKAILVDTHNGNSHDVLARLSLFDFIAVAGGPQIGSAEETWYATRA